MNANPTTDDPTPILITSGSPSLTGNHTPHDTHSTSVSGLFSTTDHVRCGTQRMPVGGGALPPNNHTTCDPHSGVVVGGSSDQPPTSGSTVPIPSPCGGWSELRIWAEMFHDAQQQRIDATNRARRGVDPVTYAGYIDALETAERVCALHLRRCYRRVVPEPVVDWQKATHGIGEHSMARLLGHLGHPVHATPHHWEPSAAEPTPDPPYDRSLAQLWQYCGHGAPGRLRKGMTRDELTAMGSPTLKMIVHLCAEACMKATASPFRLVYEKAKLDAEDRQHSTPCVRCGPSGKPAQPGTPWSPGHRHAHALRVTGKELLRDLWTVAGGNQRCHDPHGDDIDGAP